jgi:hypothetical protein
MNKDQNIGQKRRRVPIIKRKSAKDEPKAQTEEKEP